MIKQIEQDLLEQIDSMVDSATDDELFASGYLRGHISLCAAECEETGQKSREAFFSAIKQSLEDAKSELNPSDFIIVQQELIKLTA